MATKSPAKKKTAAKKAAKSATEAPDFEATLEQLETLVGQMEGGDLSLEDSLAAFEKGVKLTRQAQARLNEAEQRVSILMEEQGELVEADFEDDDD